MSPKKSTDVAEPIAETASAQASAMIEAFKAARRVSTPLVALETPDPAATIEQVRAVLNGESPTFEWDIVRGMRAVNELGKLAAAQKGIEPQATINPVAALEKCDELPAKSAVFFHNAHRHLGDPQVVQALWNLRDTYKRNRRTVILLGPAFNLPSELAGDVVVLDEPLPTRAELAKVLEQQHVNASLPQPSEEQATAALDAIVGLPAFTAEQVVAMSLTRTGINQTRLWERKVKAIENTKGLRVWRGKANLADLRGIDNVVAFNNDLMDASTFGAIVFIDEGDKAMAGGMSEHSGDSGVSKDQIGQILSYIEDGGHMGEMFAGIAGCGKTELAKAISVASGKPLIVFDMGGMKGGIVGSSEESIRTALKVITATAEGKVLFIMTANQTTSFTPELNRRFPDQFFFDLPDADGREAIWPVYIKRYGLDPVQAKRPEGFAAGWTGAEIKRVCERAALFGRTVVDTSRYIVPQCESAKATIARMRSNAAGRFLSASKPGFYMPPAAEVETTSVHRKIDMAE